MDNHKIEISPSAQYEAPVDVSDQVHNVFANQGLRPVMAVRENWRLEDIENYLERPTRIRGGVELQTMESFLEYVKEFQEPGTRVWIKQSQVISIIDGDMKGSPAWNDHRAHMDLSLTDVSRFWFRDASGFIGNHKDLARALERFRQYVEKPEGADLVSVLDSFYIIGETKVFDHVEVDRDTFRAGVERTFRGASTKKEVELPREFVLRFPMWVGLPVAVQMTVRVDYRPTEETLVVALQTVDLQWLDLTARENLKERLETSLEGVPVYL